MRGNGVLMSDPAALNAAVRNPSTASHTRSGCGYDISKSIWVNSGCRSARKSSSREQRIKRPRLYPAGYQVIARPFRRRPRHERSLNLKESLSRKVVPDGFRHLVPGLDVELHHIAPQINVAILQPRLFISKRRVRRQERRLL